MAWQTPKITWKNGDYFNLDDYNRITGNIAYLQDLTCELYSRVYVGSDTEVVEQLYADFINVTDTIEWLSELAVKELGDYLYADEMNAVFENLEQVDALTLNIVPQSSVSYHENGQFSSVAHLNFLEQHTLDLYNELSERSFLMSNINVEVKKVTDLPNIETVVDENVLPLHDGTGLKKISILELRKSFISRLTGSINASNAGAHNAIYRGKNLGSSVTAEQYAAIANGTFDDLYIGDYWVKGGVNWRIAGFDYYLNTGDTNCTTHHVVIVPDSVLYNAQMHNTESGGYEAGAEANTTEGGYANSDMRTTNLERAKTIIRGHFGDHVLTHRIYLTNAVSSGRPSAGAWFDSDVDLMCEEMVYGNSIYRPASNGSQVPANYRVSKSQLPLFQHEHSRIGNRQTWWLRDVVTASNFACVDHPGNANYGFASIANGVRPFFLIS